MHTAILFLVNVIAYLEYTSAEEESAKDDFQHMSTLLTAQAMVAFTESDRDKCKTLLYQA